MLKRMTIIGVILSFKSMMQERLKEVMTNKTIWKYKTKTDMLMKGFVIQCWYNWQEVVILEIVKVCY